MSRTENISVDALQDLVLNDTLYPNGTADTAIDHGSATPDNITGRSYEMVIHALLGDGTSLLTFTTGGGGMTIPTGTDGLLVTTISAAALATLGVGDFEYFVRRTDSGASAVVTKGTFSVVAV